MRVLSSILAILSSLLLAAHFLHADNLLMAIISLFLPGLLLVRRRWAVRVTQLVLLGGAIVWLWTMVDLANSFQEMGRPPGRMIVILTSVAAFTALSAMLLQCT